MNKGRKKIAPAAKKRGADAHVQPNPGSIVWRMRRTENSSRALKKAWLDPIRRASLSRPRIDLLNQIVLLFASKTIRNILKGPFSAPIVPVGHEKPRRAHRTV